MFSQVKLQACPMSNVHIIFVISYLTLNDLQHTFTATQVDESTATSYMYVLYSNHVNSFHRFQVVVIDCHIE